MSSTDALPTFTVSEYAAGDSSAAPLDEGIAPSNKHGRSSQAATGNLHESRAASTAGRRGSRVDGAAAPSYFSG